MSEYRRWYVPGATVFFTLVTAGRAHILKSPQAPQFLRQAIHDCRRDRPFRIIAAVLLPDHLHMIWSLPPGDLDYSTRWSSIKAGFTRRWLAAAGAEQLISQSKYRHRHRGVWQRRFWDHVIRDEDDLARHTEYIHFNPVKHGHVKCPSQWRHSSFHRFVASGIYPVDWGCPNTIALPTPPDFSAIQNSTGE